MTTRHSALSIRHSAKAFLFLLIAYCLLPVALGATVATPVNVSSISVAGSTITINTATAHGIAANRGFCLSAQSFCGTASSVTSTSITFTSTAVTACASSCGTVNPAKQVIALGISLPPNQQAAFVCWLYTASPVPGTANSAWTGASAAEKNALAAGTTIESAPQPFPVAGATLAAFKAYSQQQCANLQAALDSGIAPAFLLGNYYDGTGWLN